MPLDDHLAANLRNWQARTPIHAASATYGLERYVADPAHLSSVVAADLPHLGDLSGRRVVHLQCHIGTDTLSLARTGADVTGVDFSPAALAVARDLAARAGPPVRYVEASVDEVPTLLPERFDVVYTGVGALNWLPSARRWAAVVAGLLAPGGSLYLREGHPMLHTLGDREDDLLVVSHPYGGVHGPQRWVTEVTYTGDDHVVSEPVTYEWNHGIGEVVQALIDVGLRIVHLEELFELEWRALPTMVEVDGRYVLPDRPERLPLMYRLRATADR